MKYVVVLLTEPPPLLPKPPASLGLSWFLSIFILPFLPFISPLSILPIPGGILPSIPSGGSGIPLISSSNFSLPLIPLELSSPEFCFVEEVSPLNWDFIVLLISSATSKTPGIDLPPLPIGPSSFWLLSFPLLSLSVLFLLSLSFVVLFLFSLSVLALTTLDVNSALTSFSSLWFPECLFSLLELLLESLLLELLLSNPLLPNPLLSLESSIEDVIFFSNSS